MPAENRDNRGNRIVPAEIDLSTYEGTLIDPTGTRLDGSLRPINDHSAYHVLADQPGDTADEKLQYLNDEQETGIVFLGRNTFNESHTITTGLSLIGGGPGQARFDQDLTLDDVGELYYGLRVDGTLTLSGFVSRLCGLNHTTIVAEDRTYIWDLYNCDVTLNANGCIVDNAMRTPVTDNGSNNSIGQQT